MMVERPARTLRPGRLHEAIQGSHDGEYILATLDYVLDADQTQVRLTTFAEGMFAKLAHDLELAWTALEGQASEPAATASLVLPLRGVRVVGAVTPSGIAAEALSPSDRETCLEKMRHEVFDGGPDDVVRVDATLEGSDARLVLTLPRGRVVRVTARPTLQRSAGAVRIDAAFDVSIASLGAGPVKGPLGAFRVKDRVAVKATLVFVAAQPA